MVLSFGFIIVGLYFIWASFAKGDDIGLRGYKSLLSKINSKNARFANLLYGSLLIIGGIILFIIDWYYNMILLALIGLFVVIGIIIVLVSEIGIYFFDQKVNKEKL